MTILYRVLLKPRGKREYEIPKINEPRIILDIGANIGATGILFAQSFPKARIYCFEPVRENFEILLKNTFPYDNIFPFGVALGNTLSADRLFSSDDSTNFGGFSFFESGSNPQKKTEVKVRHPQEVMEELGISGADIIKIDTEGAEYDVLSSLKPGFLCSTRWIIGELHGERDFELLSYLEKWFDVSIEKKLDQRLCHFSARNKSSPFL